MSNQKLKVIEEFREIIDAKVDRRYFLKCTAFLGGSLLANQYLARFAQAAAGLIGPLSTCPSGTPIPTTCRKTRFTRSASSATPSAASR